MHQSIITKLEQLSMRLEEINALLSEQSIASDQNKFRELSIEHSQLSEINDQYNQYLSTISDNNTAKKLLTEDDQDIKEMAEEEISSGQNKLEQLELELDLKRVVSCKSVHLPLRPIITPPPSSLLSLLPPLHPPPHL